MPTITPEIPDTPIAGHDFESIDFSSINFENLGRVCSFFAGMTPEQIEETVMLTAPKIYDSIKNQPEIKPDKRTDIDESKSESQSHQEKDLKEIKRVEENTEIEANPTKIEITKIDSPFEDVEKPLIEVVELLDHTRDRIEALHKLDVPTAPELPKILQRQVELEHETLETARLFAEQQTIEQTLRTAELPELITEATLTNPEYLDASIQEQIQTILDTTPPPSIDLPLTDFTEPIVSIAPNEVIIDTDPASVEFEETPQIIQMEDFISIEEPVEVVIPIGTLEQSENDFAEEIQLFNVAEQEEATKIRTVEVIETIVEPNYDFSILSLELTDLFNQPEQLPAQELYVETEPDDQNILGFVSEVPVTNLFEPYKQTLREHILENQDLEPELAEAIARLEQVISLVESDKTEPLELTEQIVQDIVVILTTLGCKEPVKLLKVFAKHHDLQELYTQLIKELPDLTKLIDYQQHLLQALSQAIARSDRRQTIAQLLRNLLFVPDTLVAVPAA